jgi:hypothetical protein
MNWYIVIFTSQDWYTFYDGREIVKANDAAEASNIAYEMEDHKRYSHTVEEVIDCGKRKPKGV